MGYMGYSDGTCIISTGNKYFSGENNKNGAGEESNVRGEMNFLGG